MKIQFTRLEEFSHATIHHTTTLLARVPGFIFDPYESALRFCTGMGSLVIPAVGMREIIL